jgi:hypothetical protein
VEGADVNSVGVFGVAVEAHGVVPDEEADDGHELDLVSGECMRDWGYLLRSKPSRW